MRRRHATGARRVVVGLSGGGTSLGHRRKASNAGSSACVGHISCVFDVMKKSQGAECSRKLARDRRRLDGTEAKQRYEKKRATTQSRTTSLRRAGAALDEKEESVACQKRVFGSR